MNRRVALVAAVTLALAAAVGAGTRLLPATAAASGSPSASPTASSRPTATVERKTLAEHETLNGTLDYPKAQVVKAGVPGTITRLPAEGSVLSRGQPTAEVDGQPTSFLLYGVRPAWRDLGPSATRGADVLELKQNLRVLGFLKGKAALTSKWDAATTKAVKAWQQRLHVPVTGTLALGSVVFRPGPLRVGALAAAVGDLLAPGAPLYDTTAASQQVSAELKADLRHLARVGDPVSLLLPGGATATGRISAIGTIAHATPDGSGSTVTLSITLDDPSAAAAYAQATVSVEITTTVASDVLTVPVTALVATSGGGYAVEVVRGVTTDFVRVQPGVFANGDVAVTGSGLAVGDQVVVAE